MITTIIILLILSMIYLIYRLLTKKITTTTTTTSYTTTTTTVDFTTTTTTNTTIIDSADYYSVDIYVATQSDDVSKIEVLYKIGMNSWLTLESINATSNSKYAGTIIDIPKNTTVLLGLQSLGSDIQFNSYLNEDFPYCGKYIPLSYLIRNNLTINLVAKYTDGLISC